MPFALDSLGSLLCVCWTDRYQITAVHQDRQIRDRVEVTTLTLTFDPWFSPLSSSQWTILKDGHAFCMKTHGWEKSTLADCLPEIRSCQMALCVRSKFFLNNGVLLSCISRHLPWWSFSDITIRWMEVFTITLENLHWRSRFRARRPDGDSKRRCPYCCDARCTDHALLLHEKTAAVRISPAERWWLTLDLTSAIGASHSLAEFCVISYDPVYFIHWSNDDLLHLGEDPHFLTLIVSSFLISTPREISSSVPKKPLG